MTSFPYRRRLACILLVPQASRLHSPPYRGVPPASCIAEGQNTETCRQDACGTRWPAFPRTAGVSPASAMRHLDYGPSAQNPAFGGILHCRRTEYRNMQARCLRYKKDACIRCEASGSWTFGSKSSVRGGLPECGVREGFWFTREGRDSSAVQCRCRFPGHVRGGRGCRRAGKAGGRGCLR